MKSGRATAGVSGASNSILRSTEDAKTPAPPATSVTASSSTAATSVHLASLIERLVTRLDELESRSWPEGQSSSPGPSEFIYHELQSELESALEVIAERTASLEQRLSVVEFLAQQWQSSNRVQLCKL